jgi:integrase
MVWEKFFGLANLIPFFGSRDLTSITEATLLDFIKVKLAEGLKPKTIENSLSVLRRVYSVLQREERVIRNPASGIGQLMRRVGTRLASETSEVEFWETHEIETLIHIARESEPRFAPLFEFLISTGVRRGEALGLQWVDIDFDNRSIRIRRAITASGMTTPKSGKARTLKMPESLAATLFDLLSDRRIKCLQRGWPEVPEWVFCSETGTAPDPGNIDRTWRRLRRRAQAEGVRPLKLHAARHTWATRALGAGKSVRWVADQLGHADPALTLRVYAHAMREEETDLSFAEFGGSKRLYPAPASEAEELESDNPVIPMARREGFEPPTLRFEGISSLVRGSPHPFIFKLLGNAPVRLSPGQCGP